MAQQPHAPEPPVWDPSHQGTGSAPRSAAPRSAGNDWASGGTVFAGVLMLVNGLLAVLQGIAAIAEDDVYARLGDYVYEVSLTGWGWILVILGVVAAATGAGILQGAAWARAARHPAGLAEPDRPVPVPAVRAALVDDHDRHRLLRHLGPGDAPPQGVARDLTGRTAVSAAWPADG
ncbi:hypothetical protein SGLAM104S_10666 [Streptomyces glaucescens]